MPPLLARYLVSGKQLVGWFYAIAHRFYDHDQIWFPMNSETIFLGHLVVKVLFDKNFFPSASTWIRSTWDNLGTRWDLTSLASKLKVLILECKHNWLPDGWPWLGASSSLLERIPKQVWSICPMLDQAIHMCIQGPGQISPTLHLKCPHVRRSAGPLIIIMEPMI